MQVIDFHAHAFPDALAARAIERLEAEARAAGSPCRARLDGRLSSLLASMDRSGVAVSVVASIATKPSQFASILAWSREIVSPRIVPFASVHPGDPEAAARVREIAASGLKGIKLHPYYQGFAVDEARMTSIYREIEDCGLVLLLHAGFDIAFPRDRIADPARIARVMDAFPRLVLVAAHMGGWEDWEEVERYLLGRRLFMDVSYSLHCMPRERARRILERHPAEYLLFGSDSPWDDQAEALERVLGLGLAPERLEALLGGNAARLLGLDGAR